MSDYGSMRLMVCILLAFLGSFFLIVKDSHALNTFEAYRPGLSEFDLFYQYWNNTHTVSALSGYGYSNRANPYLGVDFERDSSDHSFFLTLGNIATLYDSDFSVDQLVSIRSNLKSSTASIGMELAGNGALMPYSRIFVNYNLEDSLFFLNTLAGVSVAIGSGYEFLIEAQKVWRYGSEPKFSVGLNQNLNKDLELLLEGFYQNEIGGSIGLILTP